MKKSVIQYNDTSPTLYLGTNIDRGFTPRDFIGELDEVIIWDKPLDSNDIISSIKHPPKGTEKGVAGYWNFDGGEERTCLDLTGNQNHGVLKEDARKVEGLTPEP